MQIREFLFEEGKLKEISTFPEDGARLSKAHTVAKSCQGIMELPFVFVLTLIIFIAAFGAIAVAKGDECKPLEPAPVFFETKMGEDVGGSLSTSLVSYDVRPDEADSETPQQSLDNTGSGEAPAAESVQVEPVADNPVQDVFYEVPAVETGKKTFMDYRTITARRSKQWALQHDSKT